MRLYLSPVEQAGGFAGVPRQTQCFASPWGPPPYNGGSPPTDVYYYYNQIVGAGRNLPCFPFTTVKPTGAATAVDWDIPVTMGWNPLGGSYPYYATMNTLATPTLLGVIGLTSNLTVNATDFIPGTTNPVTGQWSYEWYPNNYLGSQYSLPTAEPEYHLLPGIAYVWRPSTATMVGFLWSTLSEFGSGYSSWGLQGQAAYSTQFQGPIAYVGDQAPGSYLWTCGGTDFRRSAYNMGGQLTTGYHQNVAALAGDVIVVEFWKINIHSVNAAIRQNGNMRGRQTIGGGFDATLINGRDTPSAGYNYAFETTPTHNTFVELPSLTTLTFPTGTPSPAYGPPPTLIEINPSGDGLNVVFDSPVNVGTPTFGAPTVKLSVAGASQVSGDTLHATVNPGALSILTAKANANGIDLVFDGLVAVGATPDYGTTVNNVRVVTATPLSTTEVQLFTTVVSGTYEWLATPVVVTGVGVLPHVVAAWAESNTTFVLIFNEAVVESSAVNIANYAITPALDIISIEKMDSTTYRMHTSQQTGNTTYYVTLTGVIDPANNPI